MVFLDQLVAFGGRELGKRLLTPGIPRPVHDLLKRMDVHVLQPQRQALVATSAELLHWPDSANSIHLE